MHLDPITIETTVNAPLSKVWDYWTDPKHIVNWAFASDDWEAPSATNDLRVGGKFNTRMSAKDKSAGFDFTGTYTAITDNQIIEYDMDKGDNDDHPRHVKIDFQEVPEGTKVTVNFDPETENPVEMQKSGWQSISDNFKKYVENN
jgi:uncharacterized protein YndB with AHSA1/START domain